MLNLLKEEKSNSLLYSNTMFHNNKFMISMLIIKSNMKMKVKKMRSINRWMMKKTRKFSRMKKEIMSKMATCDKLELY